jgi:hypothetical protein
MARWVSALREVVLETVLGRLVIFIDEIGVVGKLPFSPDEFFAGIRSCHSRRTEDPALGRLAFCLLGTATPSDLLRDPRTTAFNIGQRIDLFDFTPQEAAPLARGLGRDDGLAAQLMERILYWTGGQPYLTQNLCQAVAADPTVRGPAGVDRVCERRFLARDVRDHEANLKEVERQMLHRGGDVAGVLSLYRRIRRLQTVRTPADPAAGAAGRRGVLGRLASVRVPHDAKSPVADVLRISGITRVIEGYLWVRNRVYYRVFDNHWVRVNMPEPEKRRQRRAFARGVAVTASIALPVILLIGWLFLQAYWNRRWAAANEEAAEGILNQTHATLQSIRVDGKITRELLLGVKPERLRDLLAVVVRNRSDPLIERVLTLTLRSYDTLPLSQKRTTMYHRVLAVLEHDRGDIAYELGDFPEAEGSYRLAVDHQAEACSLARKNYPLLYRTLMAGKAKIREYQLTLNEYYASLIATRLAAGQGREAEQEARVRLAQCAGAPELLCEFARALARNGRGGDRDGLPRRRPRPEERAQLDGLAVQALERAVAEGYEDLPRLSLDPDLLPLRSRSDFARLGRNLAAGSGRLPAK